jgi:hypothetical protein
LAIQSVKALVDAEEAGQTFLATWRKVPNAATGAACWFDTTLSSGNPLPFYYASSPLVGVPMGQSVNGGLPHNLPVAPLGYKTFLKNFTVSNTTNLQTGPIILMDYQFYYPFIDMGATDEQFLDNTATLTRNTTGAGLKIIAVQMAGQIGTGNPRFIVNYTNSDGVSGRVTPPAVCGNSTVVGALITTTNVATNGSNVPFLALQEGDTGVRSIESVTFQTADIGLIALVLVKPIENIMPKEIASPSERVPVMDYMDLPVIPDNAYLSLLVNVTTNANGMTLNGIIQTVWG